ncbi:MAG: hypothetical protein HFI17_08425 [Lachnospiraceae bacterium]|nr:hypothetical protein [Lachnospiraceae bacterium]
MTRNKEEQARLEGMAQALRIAKAEGVEGLEADLKMSKQIMKSGFSGVEKNDEY